ncbi:hypothetical protein HPB52_004516 [Rhipicephalus sanguineus]|uniref:Uncharacterized protein n=1 Tax=Rhipicephalus sanguineus TaxID=34632 RepID=A0A9D4SU95_RHISA|nr:hypothetical protein HPB52_004516 [Rhipicephalus sanguineus]
MSDVPRLAAAGLPLQFPSAFAAVHAAIPVDQRTHEGRYVWEPRLHAFPHAPAAGVLLPRGKRSGRLASAIFKGHLTPAMGLSYLFCAKDISDSIFSIVSVVAQSAVIT